MIETLEHIKPEEISKVLSNLANLLKKTGTFIVTVPSINLHLEKKHYQHFTTESLRKNLEKHFTVDKIIGRAKIGPKRKIFRFLQKLGVILYPFRNKIPFIRKYYSYLKKFYYQKLLIGNPDECMGLIAVCKKKKFISS